MRVDGPTARPPRRSGETRALTPQRVEQLAGRRVTAVAAGGGGLEGGHTAFVLRDGDADALWVCGHGRWGQLGNKAFTHISEPRRVAGVSSFREWDEAAQRVVPVRISQVAWHGIA